MAHDETKSAATWLDLPATPHQKWSAFAVAGVVLVGLGAFIPFARKPLAELNAFFPSLDAIVVVTDLITAVLLFAQFSISQSRALLALAIGYLFTALIVIPHALTFAGAFSPTGLLGSGPQTGSWLYLFWHIGFAVSLLAYALLKGKTLQEPTTISVKSTITGTIVAVICAVCGLTWLATAGAKLLPPIIVNNQISPFVVYPVGLVILISTIAIAVMATRRWSTLDLWLMVVAFVSISEIAISGLFPTVRFSLGFYASRVLSIVTSSIVLIVLLAEITRLYLQLAHSNAMLRRERDNKLMNLEAMSAAIAHELKQPLGAITLSGEAAVRYLDKTPPNFDQARSLIKNIVSQGHEADQMLQSIRAVFGRGASKEEPIVVNELVFGALRSFRAAMIDNNVTTQMELASELPPVLGDKGQLQEVVNNLIQNSIDAMGSIEGRQRILAIRTKSQPNNAILLEIQDTGPGIDAAMSSKVFDAFTTTKSHGMGLGLAICQTIIQRHGGKISVGMANPCGALFRIVLPCLPPHVS
jgi:signal transduction histidine kinase